MTTLYAKWISCSAGFRRALEPTAPNQQAQIRTFRRDADAPDRYIERVANWDQDAEATHPVDYRLVHNTFVTMFWQTSLLDETVRWLRSHDYRVVEFDAASWSSDVGLYGHLYIDLFTP